MLYRDSRTIRCVVVVMAILIGAISAPVQAAPSAQLNAIKISLVPVLDKTQLPTVITHAGDGSKRIFIVEKPGRILILKDGKLLSDPFLDITAIVRPNENERGLLGLAFHPKYKENGFFFVYYTASPSGDITVARYKVSDKNPDQADKNSAKILIAYQHSRSNHNGGQLAFGPDGYLYTAFGDGGGAGDPDKAGQNLGTLAAKMVRLDVDKGDPYGIPADNPFVSNTQAKPEIWAYGLRNAWRFSFDRQTGDLYIADVGQNKYEEINFQAAGSKGGENYGWSVVEANHCFTSTTCNPAQFAAPILEYDHSAGCSVTGGYVYRGKTNTRLQGIYFYADYCSGRLWGAQRDSSGKWQIAELLRNAGTVSTFGEDEDGELYLADYSSGKISKVVEQAP